MQFKVPFVNYPLEYKKIKKEIDKAIRKCLTKGDLILRDDVEKFEKDFSNYIGTKYGVGVNSCTDALIICLKACGIGPGDKVITVSHTFWASIEAILHVGAEPVLVDVGEDYLMDINDLEKKIDKEVKAIIPVHFNGRVCNMPEIMRIAEESNCYVIEDAAQAIGATYNGKMAGSWGHAGCFSFYPSKILGAYGDGGFITTNHEFIKHKAWLYRAHGQGIKQKNYPIIYAGWSSRLQNIQAAALNVKMKYLDSWVQRRRDIAARYDAGLEGIVTLPPKSDETYNDSYQNYVIRAEKRDELFEYLKNNGVETLIKDPVANHHQPALEWTRSILPVSEQLCDEVISLPMYPDLTDDQVDYVIKIVKKFYEA